MTTETKTRASRGPYAQGLAAQKRILEEATELFGRHGFRGTSLDAIAKASGITKQGLLHHFPNKKRLLVAVLKYRDTLHLDDWPGPKTLVGTEILDHWDWVVERNLSLVGIVRLSHLLAAESSSGDHPAREYFLEHFDNGRSMLVDSFTSGIKEGQLRKDIDPETIARQVIGVLEGLENQWLIDPDNVDIVKIFHDYTRQLRATITA
ncbi:TetR/AcrR family transcriptional regulator [Paenarthrobacter sp. NPDC057981]|uniref:TetR/AcrR family transcriptional regulator n=1 Tax=Paenarthrobacter sp. NPDC057981 TaxID=3346297 RepID=UPI0036D7EF43